MKTNLSYKSALHEMTQSTPTCLWNDSASIQELTSSMEHGAVGATCNPVIILEVLRTEMHLWEGYIRELIRLMTAATEDQIAWKMVEAMSVKAAKVLLPVFQEHRGRNGRLSVQTDPRLYRDSAAIVDQAMHLDGLAPNIIVKIPVTAAGLTAMEEATYRGVSINATVSFSVPQAIAVAESVERGLKRREQEGKDIATMGPVCTIMVGRLDDWLKVVADKQGITVDPGILEWAGVAVFKRAYAIYQERGYRLRLLSAAFRNHMHWSELIGGDVVISPPYKWQQRFNSSGVEIKPRIDTPVDPEIVSELLAKFDDFRRAYAERVFTTDELGTFGPTVRTLRQFIGACHDLDGVIRDFMLPNPD
jgi:transaldolase